MFVKARERFQESFAKLHQKRASRYHEALKRYHHLCDYFNSHLPGR